MNRIINMIIRRLMNIGVNKGIDMVANRGRSKDRAETAEDREMVQKGRNTAKNMRQASRVIKRINRF